MAHHIGKVGEYAIIRNTQGQFLMVLLHDPQQWHFPGGRIDEGEQALEGLHREIREETGITVTNVVPVHTTIFTDEWKYGVFYTADAVEPSEIRCSAEHCDVRWFSLEELDQIDFWQPFYRELIEKYVYKNHLKR